MQAIGPIAPRDPADERVAASGAAPKAAPAAAAGPAGTPEPSAAAVGAAVRNINQTMRALSQGLEFSIDDGDARRVIVKVVDQQTKEVIRQIPSAEALEIAKALDRVQGLLIRQKA
jgi:flagellar protein FlaG